MNMSNMKTENETDDISYIVYCSFSFEDEETEKTYEGKVVFQVLVSPDCYEEGPTTIGSLGIIDPEFDNSKIEWSTTERGSVILYGLLIHLEEDE